MIKTLSLICLALGAANAARYTFPTDFKFGAASASYQIEGAWEEDGKSPNIWDWVTHKKPDFVDDRSNGDVAADSYHMFEKDIQALKDTGVSGRAINFRNFVCDDYNFSSNSTGFRFRGPESSLMRREQT